MELSYQGSADGLCGMYAIVNALMNCCLIEDYPPASRRKRDKTDLVADRILQRACLALDPDGWPSYLWSGTTFEELKVMIEACIKPVKKLGVEVRYPFEDRNFKSIADFWDAMGEEFESPDIGGAIIRINNPHNHWLAIFLDGRRVYVLNSDAENTFDRMNVASLSARKSEATDTEKKKWSVDRNDVALFYRRPV